MWTSCAAGRGAVTGGGGRVRAATAVRVPLMPAVALQLAGTRRTLERAQEQARAHARQAPLGLGHDHMHAAHGPLGLGLQSPLAGYMGRSAWRWRARHLETPHMEIVAPP